MDCQSTKKCQRYKNRIQTSSMERRHRRPSVEVWGVCEKTPLPRGTRRRAGTGVVTHAHALSPGHRRCRLGVDVVAQAGTLLPLASTAVVRRRLRATTGVVAHAGPICARTSQGIKGLAFPSLLTLLPSEASWPRLALQQLLARTSWTLAFFSYCVICLCESHRRTVDHLHILDYERPYYLLSILQKWRGGGKRQRSGSHGLRGYRMDIQ